MKNAPNEDSGQTALVLSDLNIRWASMPEVKFSDVESYYEKRADFYQHHQQL